MVNRPARGGLVKTYLSGKDAGHGWRQLARPDGACALECGCRRRPDVNLSLHPEKEDNTRRSLPVRVRARTERSDRTSRGSAEVSSRPRAAGSAGEGSRTKGPGRATLGDGILAGMVRQTPPLEETPTGT